MDVIDGHTREAVASLPVRTLLRTDQVGWRSALVHECESPPRMDEPFETSSAPDPVLKLVLVPFNRWFIQKANGWQTYDAVRGGLCFTRANETHRLRWRRESQGALRMIHLYIPEHTLSSAAQEMETRHRGWAGSADAFFDDPVLANLVLATADAARKGASDNYAQSAATLIAYHVLSGKASPQRRTYPHISDRRLLRVLGFIEAHYDQPFPRCTCSRSWH